MDDSRFDAIAKLISGRLTRRRAPARGGAGLATSGLAATGLDAVAAQEASPEPAETDAASGPALLFVQTFRAGAIAPKEGTEGRYTLALEGGHGQTIYFSDRPDRVVGATPTDRFLGNLGFGADNPPNAALVVETAPGEIDVAVVELFSPDYDAATGGVTYEIEVLGNWQTELGIGLSEAPTDLAAVEPSFGAAHLFIDSATLGVDACPNQDLTCYPAGSGDPRTSGHAVGTIPNADFGGWCLVPGSFRCQPCSSPAAGDTWENECDRRFPDGCEVTVSKYVRRFQGSCVYFPQCTTGNPYQSDCYPNY